MKSDLLRLDVLLNGKEVQELATIRCGQLRQEKILEASGLVDCFIKWNFLKS